MLHFCASSFCVIFFSHRAAFTASDVALPTYFVFFMSSSEAALYTPTFASEDVVVAAGLLVAFAAVVGRLLNVTVVQSWQSGTVDSLSSYLDITHLARNMYIMNTSHVYVVFIQKKVFF
jgi:hypothetical protein